MKVGLSSRVDLSCNIKGGWESSTDGGNCVSIASSISVSTSDGWGSNGWGGNGWGGDGTTSDDSTSDGSVSSSIADSSDSWGSGDGWGGDGRGSNGRASSIANGAERASATSSKVVSLSCSNSRLIIGSDSTVGVNPQAKRSSSKSLRTSIASIAVSRGISGTIVASLSGSKRSGTSNLQLKIKLLFL